MDQVQADLPPASIVAPNRQSCHLLIMVPLLILMENIMVKMKITIIELSGLNLCCKNDCLIPKMPTTATIFFCILKLVDANQKNVNKHKDGDDEFIVAKGQVRVGLVGLVGLHSWSHVRVRVGRGDSVEPCWSVVPWCLSLPVVVAPHTSAFSLPAPSPVAPRPQPIAILTELDLCNDQ